MIAVVDCVIFSFYNLQCNDRLTRVQSKRQITLFQLHGTHAPTALLLTGKSLRARCRYFRERCGGTLKACSKDISLLVAGADVTEVAFTGAGTWKGGLGDEARTFSAKFAAAGAESEAEDEVLDDPLRC